MKKVILFLCLLFFGGLKSMESNNNNNNNVKKDYYATLSKDTKNIILDFLNNRGMSNELKSIITYKILSFNKIKKREISSNNKFLVYIDEKKQFLSRDYILKVMDIEKNEIVWSMDSVCNFKISPDNKILVCNQYNKNHGYDNLMVYDLETGKFRWSPNIRVSSYEISSDNKTIIIQGSIQNQDRKFYVFNLDDGKLKWKSNFNISNIGLKLTSDYVVLKKLNSNQEEGIIRQEGLELNKESGSIHLLDLNNGNIIASLLIDDKFHQLYIQKIIGDLVLIENYEAEELIIWNWKKGILRKFDKPFRGYRINYNKGLIALSYNHEIQVHNLEANEVLWKANIGVFYSCSMSSNGEYIFIIEEAVDIDGKKLQLTKRNFETGEVIEILDENGIISFVLTSDNKFLILSKNNFKKIKVINLETKENWEENVERCTNILFEPMNNEYIHVTFYYDKSQISCLHRIYKLKDGKLVFETNNNVISMNFNQNYLLSNESNNLNITLNPLEVFLNIFYKQLNMHQIKLIYDIYNMDNLIKQKHNGMGIDISNKSYKVWLTEQQIEIFKSLSQFFRTALLHNFNWLKKSFGIKPNNNNNNNSNDANDELVYRGRHECNIQ